MFGKGIVINTFVMKHTQYEYSVCKDCFEVLLLPEPDGVEDPGHNIEAAEAEIRDKHFDHPDTTHYHWSDDGFKDEFSWEPCELCDSKLGGSRHSVTLNLFGG